jgi:hypothetical protein
MKSAHKPPERDTPRRHGDDFQWPQASGKLADILCDAKPFFRLPGEPAKINSLIGSFEPIGWANSILDKPYNPLMFNF